MASPYDQSFKITAETEASDLLRVLARLQLPQDAILIDLERELAIALRRVDHLYKVIEPAGEWIIHLEAFARYPGDDKWFTRHAQYGCLIWTKYNLPFRTICLLLTETGAPDPVLDRIQVDAGGFQLELRLQVVKLWEIPARELLQSGRTGLLPWVPLTRATDSELREAVTLVKATGDPELRTMMTTLAGLRYLKDKVADMFFTEELVQDSSVYQDWKTKFRQEGQRQGHEEGRLQGERAMLTKWLESRFGTLPPWAVQRIDEADSTTLQRWASALVHAGTLEDALS